ncbi:MAG: SLC13 family permease [Chloroflexota bacterium]
MTFEIGLILFILGAAIILFASEWVRVDVVSIMVMLALILTGILEPQEAFAEFGNPAVVTVWAIYIVSASLTYTGIAEFIGRYLERIGGHSERRLILVIMLTVGVMSAFMNNIGATAVLLPVVISLAKKADIPVSKLLIPLAFGSLLGGVTTLIGTPPNILANTKLLEAGLEPFQLFDFAPMGLIIMFSSIIYMILVGRHLLPEHTDTTHSEESADLSNEYMLNQLLTEVRILPGSSLIDQTISDSRMGELYDVTVIGVKRGDRLFMGVSPNIRLTEDDILFVQGEHAQLEAISNNIGFRFRFNPQLSAKDLSSSDAIVAEAVVSQKAPFLGRTLATSNFRTRYGASVLAIWREESPVKGHLKRIPLRLGDTLLIHGRRENIEALRDDSAFLLLRAPDALNPRLNKAPINLIIFVSMITLVGAGILDIAVAAVLGAILSVITGCLNMDEAYKSIEWKTVFLIAGMLPMGIAMEKTGTATFLSEVIVNTAGTFGSTGLLTGFFLLTTLLTAFMSNAAVAALVTPIAIQTSFTFGIDPHPLVLGVAIAASNSFVTPIGHQACVLVYGPGGYRFFDYARVGLPLTVLIWLLTVIFLPILWPF